MTDEEKAKRLTELVPEMREDLAFTWFPVSNADMNDHGSLLRAKIIQAVKDIEAGITETPLYKALE